VHNYFGGIVRFASQGNALQVRPALHPLVLLLAAMVYLIVVAGASAPAMAHAGHRHHAAKITTTSTPLNIVPVVSVEAKTSSNARVLPHGLARYAFASRKMPPVSDGESSCCCGSFVCHACVTLPAHEPRLPVPTGERLTPGPSGGMVQHRPLRLDRPPRSTHSANAGQRPAA
jgi:hypothetical protein